jgi:16S rRNA processing protein RimM
VSATGGEAAVTQTHGPVNETESEGGGQRFVTLGRVSGAHGVQGWVKVYSETDPRENIVGYSPWYLGDARARTVWKVTGGRRQGKAVVAKLSGCNDRDTAESLQGLEIAVRRDQLPEPTVPGEYYWADLVGLRVETVDGIELGQVERLFETGANDVIVVQGERERLIPYLWGQVVRDVDLDAGLMRVDWDPDF